MDSAIYLIGDDMKKFFLMVMVAVLCGSLFLAGCQEEQENVSEVSSDVISQEKPNGLLPVQREETEKTDQVRLELSAAQYPVDVEKISFLLINEGKQMLDMDMEAFIWK